LEASSLETQLFSDIPDDDGSWKAPFGGGVEWSSAGWQASWGLQSSCGGICPPGGGQGLSHFIGVAAGSGPWRLALLGNCQCGVGQHRRMVLAASTLGDDFACSRQRRVAQLGWAIPVRYPSSEDGASDFFGLLA